MNKTIENAKKILKIFKVYHRYHVEGIDSFPEIGPVLLVTNHSLATYDGFLLGLEILNAGRLSVDSEMIYYFKYLTSKKFVVILD